MPFANIEKGKKYRADYYKRNKERIKIYRKMHPLTDEQKKRAREQTRTYQRSERFRNLQKTWKQRRRQKIKLEVFVTLSGNPPKCQCCGERILAFLSIDHIKEGEGYKHRKRFGSHIYEWIKKNKAFDGLQVLCMNCNFGKRMNKGICPHKTQSVAL